MFQALTPLLAERTVVITLNMGADGLIFVHVNPIAKKEETTAHCIPFTARTNAKELDAGFAETLTKWVADRHPIVASLDTALAKVKADTTAAAEDAKKKAAERAKKPVSTPTKPAALPAPKVVTPSLLDGLDGDGDENGERNVENPTCVPALAAPAEAPAVRPATVETPPIAAPVMPLTTAEASAPAPAVTGDSQATASRASSTADPVILDLF